MSPAAHPRSSNILLTGPPGIGKTTLLKKVISQLSGLTMTGFFTEEIRQQGRRTGFRAVTLSGSSVILAQRKSDGPSSLRVGPYVVSPAAFEQLVLPHLDPERRMADLTVIDEIGKMELISRPVKAAIEQLLDSPWPLLATIAEKGTGLLKRTRRRPDVVLNRVTTGNRAVLHHQILRQIRALLDTPGE